MLLDAKKSHKKWVDELLKKFPMSEIQNKLHLLKGDPAVLIPEVAKREKVDLIVMGTVCRTGIPGFIISVITSYYVFLKYAKLWELRKNQQPTE